MASLSARQDVLDAIREICGDRTPDFPDDHRSFADYGLDSLDISQIFLALEKRLKIAFDSDEIERTQSLADLTGLVEKCRQAAG